MSALWRWDDPAVIRAVLEALRRDAVVVLPTDTLYGFSGRARSPAVLAKIAALKGIADPRGFVALVDSVAALRRDAGPGTDPRVFQLLERAGPVPLSVVIAVREAQPWGEAAGPSPGVPAAAAAPAGTAAYRIPAHARLREVLAALGEPVVSTSVNRTGTPPLTAAAAILSEFASGIAGCVFDPECEARVAVASTLADCTGWPPRVLRPGAFDLDAALAGFGT